MKVQTFVYYINDGCSIFFYIYTEKPAVITSKIVPVMAVFTDGDGSTDL